MSGTDAARGAIGGTEVRVYSTDPQFRVGRYYIGVLGSFLAIVLRVCYAVSGTDSAYAATTRYG
eukprot:692140-Rhodomonas_salina.6